MFEQNTKAVAYFWETFLFGLVSRIVIWWPQIIEKGKWCALSNAKFDIECLWRDIITQNTRCLFFIAVPTLAHFLSVSSEMFTEQINSFTCIRFIICRNLMKLWNRKKSLKTYKVLVLAKEPGVILLYNFLSFWYVALCSVVICSCL